MFCDLVGSTALSERLDPEELRDLMQAYQRACGEVIEKYEGHVAQYLGDGLMVYFGWPTAHEDDAVRAIRAGLEAVEAVSKLDAATQMRARAGIHTGVVVVGETGHGDASIPKAAVGDTPNIAARLQSLAEAGSVVVSERTSAMARGLFDYTDLGAHALKGINEPMRVLRVGAARTIDSRFEAARDELALTPLVGREEEIAATTSLAAGQGRRGASRTGGWRAWHRQVEARARVARATRPGTIHGSALSMLALSRELCALSGHRAVRACCRLRARGPR
jgi:class 3 adenylate cyclase